MDVTVYKLLLGQPRVRGLGGCSQPAGGSACTKVFSRVRESRGLGPLSACGNLT